MPDAGPDRVIKIEIDPEPPPLSGPTNQPPKSSYRIFLVTLTSGNVLRYLYLPYSDSEYDIITTAFRNNTRITFDFVASHHVKHAKQDSLEFCEPTCVPVSHPVDITLDDHLKVSNIAASA